jgi:peptide/nickel transport system substrate-binding protein
MTTRANARRTTRTRGVRYVAVALAAVTAFAACGGDDDDDAAPASEPATADTSAPAPGTDASGTAAPDTANPGTEAPATGEPGGVVNVIMDFASGPGPLFDSAKYVGGLYPYMQLMYDTMVYQSPEGLQPGLATDWAFPDARTIELTLRSGVTFQDGTPFDAEAVKFNLDRVIAATEISKGPAIAAMESVEAVGADQVIIHLNADLSADFRDRYLISSTSIAILSPAKVEAAGGDPTPADLINAGAGPYALTSYEPGQRISLRGWDGYWNDEAGFDLEGVDYVQATAGAPTLTALAGGAGDMAFMGGTDIATAESQGLTVTQNPRPDYFYGFYFCTTDGVMANVDARKAVVQAVDRAAIVSGAFSNGATENWAFLPTTSPYYPTYENPYPLDIEAAKASVEAAGVAEGTTVTMMADSNPLNNAVMQTLQQQLKQIGLEVEIIQSQNAYLDLPTRVPDIYFQAGGGNYVAQASFLLPEGSGNYCKMDDPTINAAWAATRDPSLDTEGLIAAWNGFQEAVDEVLPSFTVATPNIGTVTRDVVTGVGSMDPSAGEPPAWASIWKPAD